MWIVEWESDVKGVWRGVGEINVEKACMGGEKVRGDNIGQDKSVEFEPDRWSAAPPEAHPKEDTVRL